MGIYVSGAETVDGSEKWSFQRRGETSASVTLWCAGDVALNVIQRLLTPLAHPIFPSLYVKTVSSVGIGKGTAVGQTIGHEKVQLEVTYTPWASETYTETVSLQAQMITLPKWLFRWSNGRIPADGEEPSRIVRTQKITHAYDRLSTIPTWAYTDVGKVNSTAIITSTGLVCAAETLLYEGAETSRFFSVHGTEGWQMTTNFSYNPNGWNKWFNCITGTWLTFNAYQEGQWSEFKMYESANLSNKF